MIEQLKGPIYNSIRHKLISELSPEKLLIVNTSEQHRGHRPHFEAESHFEITIVSDKFKDQNLVSRHKKIYKILENELSTQVHALSIKAFTPKEYDQTE